MFYSFADPWIRVFIRTFCYFTNHELQTVFDHVFGFLLKKHMYKQIIIQQFEPLAAASPLFEDLVQIRLGRISASAISKINTHQQKQFSCIASLKLTKTLIDVYRNTDFYKRTICNEINRSRFIVRKQRALVSVFVRINSVDPFIEAILISHIQLSIRFCSIRSHSCRIAVRMNS